MGLAEHVIAGRLDALLHFSPGHADLDLALQLLDVAVDEFIELCLPILIDVFVGAHIATANLNNQPVVDYLGAELLLPEPVLAVA